MIIGIIVLAIVMKRTTYGMRVYAVGGNRNAAEIAGINAKNVLFSVYALSGLLAGHLRRHAGLARHLRARRTWARATSSTPSPRSSSAAPA